MQADDAKYDAGADGLAQILLSAMKLGNKLSTSETFAKHGLTISEWLLLSAFPGDGTPVTIGRLAVLTGLTPTRVKVLMVNLQTNGLVEGSSGDSGRSSKPFFMSANGRSLNNSIRKDISAFQESVSTPVQAAALLRASRVLGRASRTVAHGRSPS